MAGTDFNLQNDEGMFKGAPAESFEKAKVLRCNLTKAEAIMWKVLNNGVFKPYKFLRQHPVHIYIVGLYSHRLKLVIEVDGEYHHQQEQIQKDNQRTEILKFQDLNVIRFSNEEVMEQISKVKEIILNYIHSSEKSLINSDSL